MRTRIDERAHESMGGISLATYVAALGLIALTGCTALPALQPQQDDADTSALTTAQEARAPEWLGERERIAGAFPPPDDISVIMDSPNLILLRLPAAQGFKKASAEPTDSLKSMLDRVAIALEEPQLTEITIVGHTDSIGSETFNQALSIRRAEGVMEYLRQRGVPLMRMTAEGHGEAEPIADNGSETGRALNRRVEIFVRPQR